MLREGAIVSQSGKRLPSPIGSICVHGDGPDGVAIARRLRQALNEEGYRLVSLPELVDP
jgi:UPF0271 protein